MGGALFPLRVNDKAASVADSELAFVLADDRDFESFGAIILWPRAAGTINLKRAVPVLCHRRYSVAALALAALAR
jgi:hypothetical protein